MAEIPPESSRRLDSWKEIAAYLGRDTRTAMRWASAQGMPVRRVAGPKGSSVFAFADEIDLWLKKRTLPPAADPVSPAAPAAVERARLPYRPQLFAAVGLVVAITLFSVIRAGWAGESVSGAFTVSIDGLGVRVNSAGGSVKTIHTFDPAAGNVVLPRADDLQTVADLDADGETDIVAGIASQQGPVDQTIRSGRLIRLTPSGTVRWTYAFDQAVQFGGVTYAGPWHLADWRPSPGTGRRRMAAVTHHYTWWPSIATILDDSGTPVGSFVNAGWLEQVLWMDADRIVVAGFNNPLDGGLLAVLDGRNLRGRSPDGPAPYQCESCPAGDPLAYVVFPRSELNAASGSRFNRARVEIMPDRLVAYTAEISDGTNNAASAIYEFDRDMRFRAARYSDRYWEAHRRLELQGKLTHPRDRCPDADGPAAIHVWSRARGWERLAVR